MKYAIPIESQDIKDEISEVFGRSKFFAVYDSETKSIDFLENPGSKESRGAGISAVQFLIEKKINKVLTTNIGPNAENTLKSSGINLEIIERNTLENIKNEYFEKNEK